MKLIVKEYLASLKERGELDAILPDLLSQMGMNVYSRPGRGTRQDGVDVAAVGDMDGKGEKVYLFSIKAGDLTRSDWDGASAQSLRPSLNEIIDAYIPNNLPVEHRDKKIVICITLGGDIQEQVRRQLKGFLSQNAPGNVTFEEWNGDKIAEYILQYFMNEDLLPDAARSDFRKSLAMIDEPDVAYGHYVALLNSLVSIRRVTDKKRLMAIRQIAICLWILFSWSRTAGNMESAYRAAESSLLHGWQLLKACAGKKTKTARAMNSAFMSIFVAYQSIATGFLKENVLPYVGITDGLSTAVRGSTNLDVNLKLFEVLG